MYIYATMKTAVKAAIYSVILVLFVTGSILVVKAHPEVQFAFYIPGICIVLYAVIRDDLFAKPHPRSPKGK